MNEEPEREIYKPEVYLQRLDREMKAIRRLMVEVVNAIRGAETEIPERMRRFLTYAHDLHDMIFMYEVRGLSVPEYLQREIERIDDRTRQLLAEQHAPGGAFEKVRQEMAKDPNNRWDHTRQLSPPGKETL